MSQNQVYISHCFFRKYIIIVLCVFAFYTPLFSQTTQTLFYSTREGLPSNSVYKSILDPHGYLWIATENGIAKFDGRNFKIYTTAHGLPDNEITDLFIDSNKVIWVTPFRRTPCYYNPIKDRFENDETDKELMKIELGNTNRGSVLSYGGMAFANNQRNFFIYKNNKVTVYKGLIVGKKWAPVDRIFEYAPGKFILISIDSLRYFSNGQITKVVAVKSHITNSEYFNHTLYCQFGNTIYKYLITTGGDVQLKLEKQLPFNIRIFSRAERSLVVTTFNGTTYPVDTATLNLKDPLLYNIPVRSVMEDNWGNSWLATIDRGLVKVQQKRISTFSAIDQLQQNFNALLVTNKKIYAGNNYGEVFRYDGLYEVKKISLDKDKNMDNIVRRIVNVKDNIFIAAQTGSFTLDKENFSILNHFSGSLNIASKAVAIINDSEIISGTHGIAYRYNFIKNIKVDSIQKRITAIGTGNGRIYLGSNDGLYRWDKNALFYFGTVYKGLSYRINTIATTADGLIWIGLASDSLLVLKNDQLIASIALGNTIPGNLCKSLYSKKAGEIWLGTNKGLNRIQYKYENGKLSHYNTFFSAADGLTGEQVNDITAYNDTLYVATTAGISYLPTNLTLPINDIITFITGIAVSGKDTSVLNEYNLPYDNNDISITFSAVDLTGYNPSFEYRTNNGDWVKLEKNTIDLKLASGKYDIEIRGIKRDGQPSSQKAKVSILIKTPFWRSGIFWITVVLLLFCGILFFQQFRNKQKQKVAVENVLTEKKLAELEMQALKAQINPHFVFNCLNSIKGFIYDKDFDQADKYLDKFSDLLRSTLDNSSSSIISLNNEIQYLDNYLQLEKLRFDDKFNYFVVVAADIDRQNIFVPAMLLQPYVENAIRHGIRHLQDKKGIINIEIKIENGELICSIDDNGVGRATAAALKNKVYTEYQSRGMQLSKRRAELYGIQQAIIDKKGNDENATGTIIILKIPLTLKP